MSFDRPAGALIPFQLVRGACAPRQVRAQLRSEGLIRLRLLIGADQALSFHRWQESRRILGLATPMVMARDEIATREDLVAPMRGVDEWSGEECERWGSWFVELEEINVSATGVREKLRAMRFADLAGVVDERVIELIRDRNCYALS